MSTYVSLLKWTDLGIRNVKETVSRAEQAKQAAVRMGGRLTGVYWTQGAYDLVALAEFPDEETAMAFLLATGLVGNVRTETLRAFTAAEMERILAKVP